MITYEPLGGCHIDEAAKEACEISRIEGTSVRFQFNGVTLTVSAETQPYEIVEQFHAELDRKAEAYRNSPEGIAATEKRRIQVGENNRKIEALMSSLPLILQDGTMDNLLDWLIEITPLADDVESNLNKRYLGEMLVDAGHCRNQSCGHSPDWYDTKCRMGDYIIGQVLDALYRGMPPHPITVSFCQKAKLLP